MWIIYDNTLNTPDILATVANLRRRYADVSVATGRSQAVCEELHRIKRDPSILLRGNIARFEDVGIVNIDFREDESGLIQFLDAEVLFDSPEERFDDIWELFNFASQSVAWQKNARPLW